jgi:hypothetical protein
MSNTTAFNPHWIGDEPCWDIRLPNGELHENVTVAQIRRSSSDPYMIAVRERDIQDYGKKMQGTKKAHNQ